MDNAAVHLHAVGWHFGCTVVHPYIENKYVILLTIGE